MLNYSNHFRLLLTKLDITLECIMTSPQVEGTDTKMDNSAQMLEDTWTTPTLPIDGPHAVLVISLGITRLSHPIALMMAIDRLIRSVFKNLLLEEEEALVLKLVHLPGQEVVQHA